MRPCTRHASVPLPQKDAIMAYGKLTTQHLSLPRKALKLKEEKDDEEEEDDETYLQYRV